MIIIILSYPDPFSAKSIDGIIEIEIGIAIEKKMK